MKIRKKDRKINIEKIFIDSNYYDSGCNVTIIINGQCLTFYSKSCYVSDVLNYINTSLDSMYEDMESYKPIERLDL